MDAIRLFFLLLFPVCTMAAQPVTIVKTNIPGPPAKVYITSFDPVTGEEVKYKARKQGDVLVISFSQLMPGDVFFQYGKNWTKLLLSPGDTLEVTPIGGSLRFTGTRALANEQLQEYLGQLYGPDKSARGKELNRHIFDSNATAMKSFLQQRFARDSAVLAGFCRTVQPDTLLRRWAWQSLRYEMADEMLRYASFRKYKNLPDDWFDTVEPLAAQPESIFPITRSAFADEYTGYHIWNVFNRGQNFVTFCESLPAGAMRDMMLTRYVLDFQESSLNYVLQPDIARIMRMLTHPAFQAYVAQVRKEMREDEGRGASLAQAKRAEGAAMAKDSILRKFTAPYAGKVLYIDVWATWCVPCRDEIPVSQRLRQRLEKDSVVFVYLCVASPEKAWKSVVDKMSIQGEHFLLTPGEYDALRETYRMQGVPHYLVVNANGKLVDRNAPGPSQEGLEETLRGLAPK